MKECPRCKLSKSLDSFYMKRGKPGGSCKECISNKVPSSRRHRGNNSSLIRNSKGQKQCYQCEDWLEESEFGKVTNTKDKLRGICFTCRVCVKSGITKNMLKQLLIKQDCRCAVCGDLLRLLPKTWAVDHDHSCCTKEPFCGKCIRGVLCQMCNMAEGLLRSDPVIIANLLEYIKNGVIK